MHLPLEAFTKFTFYNGIQFDFDSIAQPSQAWRRKLNNHASKLKEFSVTFREAIKMARLGIRLWSYVREEASYGRRALIDLFTQKRCKPSAFQGVPLGGIGYQTCNIMGVAAYPEALEANSSTSKFFLEHGDFSNHGQSVLRMQIKSANAKGVISLQHTKPDAEVISLFAESTTFSDLFITTGSLFCLQEIDEDSDTDSGGEMVHGILTSGTKSHI
ncbi:hypothetical protein T459_16721 [Capsicum annuum]|uniref:Uncharacterized protein n=1 Tax=Capsicum annuum TaxID=4072 RepID=A0A2G2Z9M6_CAPAN|nr:hypothetical protein T459_16721 [Capsicum annuum]